MSASSLSSLTSLSSSLSSLTSISSLAPLSAPPYFCDPIPPSATHSEEGGESGRKEGNLTPPSSLSADHSEEGANPGLKGGELEPSSMGLEGHTAPPQTSNSRKRRRNPDKEKERRAKRQRKRKREGTKGERIGEGKMRKAEEQAVLSDVDFSSLNSSKYFEHHKHVFKVETTKSKGLQVVRWDGV